MPGKLKKAGLPALLIIVTAVVVAFLIASRPELETVEPPERVWPVEVVTLQLGDEQPMLELFGEVIAGRRSEMRALVSGIITEVGPRFHDGAVVSEGELLVQIDPFEYQNNLAEQKALLKEAQSTVEIKRRDLKRIRDLHAENNISDQALDDALLTFEQQQSIFEQRRIGVARAERALAETRLVAPYDGVLSDVSVDLGKRLAVNDKVADIIDTGRLEVRFTLSNAQFGRIVESDEELTGREVQVEWQVGDESLAYTGIVERVGAEIDSTTGGVVVYASLEPDARTLLRPGAFVWIRLPDKRYEGVYRVPDSALYGQDRVYVVDNGRLAARRIDIVGYVGDDLLFRPADSTALRDGDELVITQIREGGEGIKVEVR